MAQTAYSNVTNQIAKVWSGFLRAQAEKQTFWGRFEGPQGSSMPIIRQDDLSKTRGGTIYLDLVLKLSGAGVTSDATALSGNEEALTFTQQSVTVGHLSHAVRWTERAQDYITHNMRQSALNQLAKWLAGKLDDNMWTELTGGGGTTLPTSAAWYAGTATSVDTLADSASGGQLELNDITECKAYAKTNNQIEPIRLENGEEYYGLVVHPYAGLKLKESSAWQTAVREGRERGATNPLFTGSLGVWDGVILYEADRVPTATNANSPAIQYAKNVFFGAQAACRAFAKYPDWREEDFDYARASGVATVLEYGQKLNVFDLSTAQNGSANTAIGSMVLYSSAVSPTA